MPKPASSYFPIFIIILFLITSATAKSQVLVNTTGNTIKDNSYHFEYSIGEISITTLSATSNNVTQGLLQSNIKKIPPPCDFLDEKVLSFENPTRNIVRIVGRYDWITDYKVYAADGKLVKEGKFYNNVIDITKFPAGVYFVKLLPGCNNDFRVLKVLKQL
jgi:hypothetical protein